VRNCSKGRHRPFRGHRVKNVEVSGVFGATREGWNSAVVEFVEGNLDPGVLVTHEFALEEIENALNVVESADEMVGKVLLRL